MAKIVGVLWVKHRSELVERQEPAHGLLPSSGAQEFRWPEVFSALGYIRKPRRGPFEFDNFTSWATL